MNLTSKKTKLDKPQENVFNFLSQPENYEKLMPENTAKFELRGAEGFLFQLKGMPEIALKKIDQQAHHRIDLGAAGGKIDFTLTALIEQLTADQCEVQFVFEGDLSPMLAMMVKKPLKKFIATLGENLQQQ